MRTKFLNGWFMPSGKERPRPTIHPTQCLFSWQDDPLSAPDS